MIVSFIFLILSAHAQILRVETIRSLLPAELETLAIHKSRPKEALKKLGKPDLIEGKKFYWERKGFKYAIELEFNSKDQLKSLSYVFIENRPALSQLGEFDQKKLILHERFLELKEKDFELKLDPTNHTISRIRLK